MRQDHPQLLFLVQTDWFFRSHRLPIAQAAMQQGYHVALACKVTRHAQELSSLGIEVYPLRFIGGQKLNPLREALSLIEIFLLYWKLRPDIVHHVSLRPVLLGSLAARFCSIKAVVHAVTGLGYLFHGTGGAVSAVRKLVVAALRFGLDHPSTSVIFQNRDDLAEFQEAGLLDESNAVLIPGSGVDLKAYHHRESHNDPPVILFGARMLREKGAAELVEAGRILRERNVPHHIQLCGEPDLGNPGAVAREELQKWHNEGAVEWLGHRDDMPDLLAQADIACLPSYYREGIPKFLIEATAASLPIVTTDMPGCRETVPNNKNGILVPPKDVNALANALERLLLDRELRINMGKESRKLAEETFAVEKVVERHIRIYEELLG